MLRVEGVDGGRCLKLIFMPSELFNKGSFLMCLAIYTFTDKITFKYCLLLNSNTKRVCLLWFVLFLPLGNREGCDCYVLTISFSTPIC